MTPSPVATLPTRAPAPARAQAQRLTRSAVQALSLTEPLPGFPGHSDYVLVAADAAGVLFWLQSVAVDGPRFLAVPAATFFPDYEPVLPASVLSELGLTEQGLTEQGLTDQGAAEILCLVTVPAGDVASATANLRAPVVVARDTHRARQVVLTDGLHPIRRPLRR